MGTYAGERVARQTAALMRRINAAQNATFASFSGLTEIISSMTYEPMGPAWHDETGFAACDLNNSGSLRVYDETGSIRDSATLSGTSPVVELFVRGPSYWYAGCTLSGGQKHVQLDSDLTNETTLTSSTYTGQGQGATIIGSELFVNYAIAAPDLYVLNLTTLATNDTWTAPGDHGIATDGTYLYMSGVDGSGYSQIDIRETDGTSVDTISLIGTGHTTPTWGTNTRTAGKIAVVGELVFALFAQDDTTDTHWWIAAYNKNNGNLYYHVNFDSKTKTTTYHYRSLIIDDLYNAFVHEFASGVNKIHRLDPVPLDQTTFYRQTNNQGSQLVYQQSLGTPDGGSSIPALGAFDARGASDDLPFSGNASNNETLSVNGTTYTYKNTLTGAANEILIGGSVAATIDNTVAAINGGLTPGGDGEGTVYGTGTVAHTTCRANDGTTFLHVHAIANTSATDSYAVSETMANASWTGTTLGDGRPYRPWIVTHTNEVNAMRGAIEDLAPYYVNAATGNPFNWTASDADNLYYVAVDQTNYDWQTTLDMVREGDLNEIDACLDELEASTPL